MTTNVKLLDSMKFFILLAFFLTASSQSFDTARFDKLLQTYVNEEGFVNYRGILKNERETVNELARQINSFSPKSHPKLFKTKKAEMVYWINAYNLLIIKTIIDKISVESELENLK